MSRFLRLLLKFGGIKTAVIDKHPHLASEVITIPIMMLGMGLLLYALQSAAIYMIVADLPLSLGAALISTGLILALDRSIVQSDFHLDGAYQYAREVQGKNDTSLLKKRWRNILVRVAFGVAISWCVVSIGESYFLRMEIRNAQDKKQVAENPKSQQLIEDFRANESALAASNQTHIGHLQQELEQLRAQNQGYQNGSLARLDELQQRLLALEQERALALRCSAAEQSGRADAECNTSGVAGAGLNYRYWVDRQKQAADLATATASQLESMKAELANSPLGDSERALSEKIQRLQEKEAARASSYPARLQQLQANHHTEGILIDIARHGVIAVNDAKDAVKGSATATSNWTLLFWKSWLLLLECAVFVARLAGVGNDYALAQHIERRNWVSSITANVAA